MISRWSVMFALGAMCCWVNQADALPAPLPLDEAIQEADVVVVGKLGRLKLEHADVNRQDVVGYIRHLQVLKGSKKLKRVKIRTLAKQIPGPVKYKAGTVGIWILKKTATKGIYEGGNPTSLQPLTKMDKVWTIIEKQAK